MNFLDTATHDLLCYPNRCCAPDVPYGREMFDAIASGCNRGVYAGCDRYTGPLRNRDTLGLDAGLTIPAAALVDRGAALRIAREAGARRTAIGVQLRRRE